MVTKEELKRRYKVAQQVEYCSSWNVPDYWIIDTDNNEVVEDGGSWDPWDEYEYFIEQKLKELNNIEDEDEDEDEDDSTPLGAPYHDIEDEDED